MNSKQSLAKKLVGYGASAAVALSAAWLVVPWEGSNINSQGQHVVYKDPVGINTFCYGNVGKDLNGHTPKVGEVYSEDHCVKLLLKRMNEFEKGVDNKVKVDYKSPYQKAAFISFSYNVGLGNLSTSTLLKKLNSGDHQDACERLTDWVYAKKIKLKGLVNRREDEMQWCLGNAPYDAKQLYIELAKAEESVRQGNSWAKQITDYVDTLRK